MLYHIIHDLYHDPYTKEGVYQQVNPNCCLPWTNTFRENLFLDSRAGLKNPNAFRHSLQLLSLPSCDSVVDLYNAKGEEGVSPLKIILIVIEAVVGKWRAWMRKPQVKKRVMSKWASVKVTYQLCSMQMSWQLTTTFHSFNWFWCELGLSKRAWRNDNRELKWSKWVVDDSPLLEIWHAHSVDVRKWKKYHQRWG